MTKMINFLFLKINVINSEYKLAIIYQIKICQVTYSLCATFTKKSIRKLIIREGIAV